MAEIFSVVMSVLLKSVFFSFNVLFEIWKKFIYYSKITGKSIHLKNVNKNNVVRTKTSMILFSTYNGKVHTIGR